MNDYNAVKDSLTVFLTSATINAEALKNIPHGIIGDMAEIVCMDLGEHDGKHTLRTVSYAEIKAWGISPDLLRADAERNAAEKKPAELMPLARVLKGLMPDGADWEPEEGGTELLIATNGDAACGAAVITYPGFLRKISGQLGGDFYLLPSSIHEVLVLRAEQNVDESALTEMVREVNRREVAEEERLSDYAYRYDAESGMLLKIA